MSIVAISGNISFPSRTENLVHLIATEAAKSLHTPAEVISIAQLAPVLATALSYEAIPQAVADAYKKLSQAELIILGSPVFKASYTGLFKHFIDLIDPKILAGKTAILAATGGSDQHASILDYQLRPLATFLGLHSVPTAIYARDQDFSNYVLQSDAIASRIEKAVGQAAVLLRPSVPTALVA